MSTVLLTGKAVDGRTLVESWLTCTAPYGTKHTVIDNEIKEVAYGTSSVPGEPFNSCTGGKELVALIVVKGTMS
jgi:hypothetical protein